MFEPEIVLAASPRDWAQRLHRHVADHGGARVRATVLGPDDALTESCDVFVIDDTTSFLTARLVDELHRRGRLVLGVHDPQDPRAEAELRDLGVDEVVPRDATAAQLLAGVTALAARRTLAEEFAQVVADLDGVGVADLDGVGVADLDGVGVADLDGVGNVGAPAAAPVVATPRRGIVTAIGGVSGGVGATEVAIAVAAAHAARHEQAVVVDADDGSAGVAQRLGLPLYPNLRAAADAAERRTGTVAETLHAVAAPGSGLWALPGVTGPRGWAEVRPVEALAAVDAIRRYVHHVVVNIGFRLEDLPTAAGPSRYGLSRQVVAQADLVLGVAPPTPMGVTRTLEWAALVREVAPDTPVHVVVNRAVPQLYKRGQVASELTRSLDAAGVWFLPDDERVEAAGWDGAIVPGGPFTRAVAEVAAAAIPRTIRPPAAGARRRRRWFGVLR